MTVDGVTHRDSHNAARSQSISQRIVEDNASAPAFTFRYIQRGVREPLKIFARLPMVRRDGDSDRAVYFQGATGDEIFRASDFKDLREGAPDFIQVRLHDDNSEFIAALASEGAIPCN